MFDIAYFEHRKAELHNKFEAAKLQIQQHQEAANKLQEALAQYRGAFAECDESITKLKEINDGNADHETTQENSQK